jgi:hypothetical protein
MMIVSYWQYLLLCTVSTLALLAIAVWPAPKNDICQRTAWGMSIAGWGFISFRLWFGIFAENDLSITTIGAVGVTLLAAAAIVQRMSAVSRLSSSGKK